MSASFALGNEPFTAMTYGPPPGLSGPQKPTPSPGLMQAHLNGIMVDGRGNASHGESIMSYLKGREVSVPSTVLSQCGISIIVNDTPNPIPHLVTKSLRSINKNTTIHPIVSPSPSRWCGVDV